MGRLFGTDGIRGIVNETLTCETAMAVGKAVALTLSGANGHGSKYLIGMDTRESSEMLCCSMAAGIASMGGNVQILGIVPTPAVAYLVGKYDADAGIVISASHNSAEFNGIKIFNRDGYKLADEVEEQIEKMVRYSGEHKEAGKTDVGRIENNRHAREDYIDFLKSTIHETLDGFALAIDCANGSASETAPVLFASLGAECHMLSAEPDGKNINENCGSTHMDTLRKYVCDNKLDIGIAFDGDADRCLCIDSEGNVVDGDEIMAICALDLMSRGKLAKKTVVGTVMSNMGFVRFCDEHGIEFVPTSVGDRYVLEEIIRKELCFGGEQSGHIIFREFSNAGDGQLTALQLLSILKRSGKSLGEYAKCMKKYPQVTLNVPVSASGKLQFHLDEGIHSEIEREKSQIDGRVLVRVSGTEPLIRIMVESVEMKKAEEVAGRIAEMIPKRLGNFI